MTALESLIAELRKLHRIAVGGGIWNHNDVATIYTAIPTILDALEAAEQRADKLKAAIQAARTSAECPCDECLSDRLDLALKEG